MADLRIYDSSEVTVTFGGLPLDSMGGYAEDEFCRIEKMNPDFTTKEGTDGEVTRSKTNSKLTKVTLRFMSSSQANAYLSAIRLTDVSATNGAGVAPLMIRDRQGTSVFLAQKAWISKAPDKSYGKEAGECEWELHALETSRVDGGN